jgi:hypothetical protein
MPTAAACRLTCAAAVTLSRDGVRSWKWAVHYANHQTFGGRNDTGRLALQIADDAQLAACANGVLFARKLGWVLPGQGLYIITSSDYAQRAIDLLRQNRLDPDLTRVGAEIIRGMAWLLAFSGYVYVYPKPLSGAAAPSDRGTASRGTFAKEEPPHDHLPSRPPRRGNSSPRGTAQRRG